MRLEAKIRLAEALSPNQSITSLQPDLKLADIKQLSANHSTDGFSCPYCSITFKYRKVCGFPLSNTSGYKKHCSTEGLSTLVAGVYEACREKV